MILPEESAGKGFFKLRPVLRTMPREFTYSELMAAANEAGLPTASVKRYLLRLVYYQIVEKEDGKYRKPVSLGLNYRLSEP